jgi:hypothetical protein
MAVPDNAVRRVDSVSSDQDGAAAGSALSVRLGPHPSKPTGFSNPVIFFYRQLLRCLSSLTNSAPAVLLTVRPNSYSRRIGEIEPVEDVAAYRLFPCGTNRFRPGATGIPGTIVTGGWRFLNLNLRLGKAMPSR